MGIGVWGVFNLGLDSKGDDVLDVDRTVALDGHAVTRVKHLEVRL